MVKINHWGIEVNSESPITGVINSNTPEWLNEEEQLGIDLDFEEHKKVCKNEEHDECYFVGNYDSESTVIIGFRKNTEGKFEPDPEVDYSAIVGQQYTQIVQSKYISRCALCSPCFPGQGDLDTKGEFMAYTLPPEVWGGAKHQEIIKLDPKELDQRNRHPDDCGCGKCSGEDRALEAMERGIVAAEKNYGDD